MYLKLRLLIAILLFSTIALSQNKNTQVFATLSPASADSLIQANYLNPNFIILDVRTISEYNTKHIENGVEFDYYQTDFNTYLDTLIKTKVYLIHCASGGRSGSVYNSMQGMGFNEFYDLAGGISAWESAGLPITTNVTPILLPVSDTLVSFVDSEIYQEDTISVTITNYGNDTLKFTNFTDLFSTEFSTNFNINRTLTGLMDYTFNFYYNPIDLLSDSVVFTIESTGLELSFVLKGNVLTTNNNIVEKHKIKIYPNPSQGNIIIEGEFIEDVEIFNLNSQIIKEINNITLEKVLNITNLEKGFYVLKVKTKKGVINKKISVY